MARTTRTDTGDTGFDRIARSLREAADEAEVIRTGLPGEPFAGARNIPADETMNLMETTRRVFEHEIERINAQRRAERRRPLSQIHGFNFRRQDPFIAQMSTAIADAARGRAFSGEPMAVSTGIAIDSRVRIQPGFPYQAWGVPRAAEGMIGTVEHLAGRGDTREATIRFDPPVNRLYIYTRFLEVVA